MYILINGQQIGVENKPTVTRSTMDGHLTFKVIIPKENLTVTEIAELHAYIKANAPVIEFYNDNEEKVQTFEGFNLYPLYSPNREDTAWELTIENESELKYQYGLLKNRAEALEKQSVELHGVITAQDNELKAHAKVITEQNAVIEQQTALVGALEETSVIQMATIESLLLEVIPAVITDTVTIAVAEALASNSTTDPEVAE